jgi:predicted metal-dependent hydrolase
MPYKRAKPSKSVRVEFLLDGSLVQVSFKKIKNMSITASPPDGQVRMSVPHLVSMESIIATATSNLAWIRGMRSQIQAGVEAGAYPARLKYEESETHQLWGGEISLASVRAATSSAS